MTQYTWFGSEFVAAVLLRVDVASYEYHAKESVEFAAALRVKPTPHGGKLGWQIGSYPVSRPAIP